MELIQPSFASSTESVCRRRWSFGAARIFRPVHDFPPPTMSPASGRLARFSWPSRRRCFAFLYKVVKTVSPASSSKVSGCRRSCPSRRTRRETDRECQTASISVVRPRTSDHRPVEHTSLCVFVCVCDSSSFSLQTIATNLR